MILHKLQLIWSNFPRICFNSKEMLSTLNSEKWKRILESFKSFLKQDSFTIWTLASLKFGPLLGVELTKEVILHLQWSNKLQHQHPDITKVVYTHAWMHGSREYCEEILAEGSPVNIEKNWHINALELKFIHINFIRIKIYSFM